MSSSESPSPHPPRTFEHRFGRNAKRFWVLLLTVWSALGVTVVVLMSVTYLRSCDRGPSVVVYASQDQVYAEPILKDFERATGIRVRAVYDSEAVKTVGLANRLLAERAHPQCDVFWGNEELRTRQMAALGVFRETNGWAAMGHRSRRIGMRDSSGNIPAPSSWQELTNPVYRGRIAMALPLFGTTSTHFQALRQHWGESNWLAWCRALSANKPFVVDGNSVAVKFLERGEADVALTDSDDINAEIREGAKIRALPVGKETLLIPATAGVVRRCPHPAAAERLFQYLQSSMVLERLVAAGALESATTGTVYQSDGQFELKPDWEQILRDVDRATEQLQKIFTR